MKAKFSPSLMCMDFLDIKKQIEFLNSKVDAYHVDIMDGHYVKNLTLSPSFVEAISNVASKPIECHLMTTNPKDYIDPLIKAGATMISLQADTITNQAFRVINYIKNKGKKVGIVLNPADPVIYLKHYIHLLDKITVLTVDPGYAGQPFIPEMLKKIKELSEIKKKNNYSYVLEVDGSCNEKTFKQYYKSGIEQYVLGTGLFNKSKDLVEAWDIFIENFKRETES